MRHTAVGAVLPIQTEVNGNGRPNGFRNFESIDVAWKNLTYKVKCGRSAYISTNVPKRGIITE